MYRVVPTQMKNPEKAAAILAIQLISFRLKHPVKAAFQIGISRTLVENLADEFLDKDQLPIDP